jgi:hypothetical protein
MLATALGVGVVLVLTLFAYFYPSRAGLLTVGLLPWQGLEVDVGLRLTPYSLSVIGLVCGIVLRSSPRQHKRRSPISSGLLLFFLFAVGCTLVNLFTLPNVEVAGGVLRSPQLRSLLQIPMLAIDFSPLWFVGKLSRNADDLGAYVKVYIASCVLLCLLGYGQVLWWSATGVDPLPIGIVNQVLGGMDGDARLRTGMTSFGGNSLLRMSSFGGEPRDLGCSLTLALFAVQLFGFGANRKAPRSAIVAALILAVGILLTQSSSALFACALGWALLPLLRFGGTSKVKIGGGKQALVAAMLATVALTLFFQTGRGSGVISSGEWLVGWLESRTLGRGAIVEDFDDAILSFIQDQPGHLLLGVGLGNAHLFANSYVDPEFAYYTQGTAFSAKSGYLRMISEVGVLGLTLFLFPIVLLATRRAQSAVTSRMFTLETQGQRVVLLLTVLFLARSSFLEALIIAVAALTVFKAHLRAGRIQRNETVQRQNQAATFVRLIRA